MWKWARRCAQDVACLTGITCLTAVACTLAQAQVSWDVSGFASFGAGRVSQDDLTYMDYNGDWSFDSDTMLGLQGILAPTERMSITGQVVSRGFSFDTDNAYQPEIEWLFVSYELTSETRVRAGRLRAPHYLFSESLEIGYSYPWVRPPVDMYVFFLEPFSHFDGADISWQSSVGEVETELKAFAGRMSGEFLGIDIDVSRLAGLVASARWNETTLRYGVNTNRTDLTLPLGDLVVDGFNLAASAFPDAFAGLSENFFNDNQEYQYHGIGIEWEPGDWSVIAEKFLFLGPKEQFSLDSRGWYISMGRQFGNWMPYTVVGDYRTRIDSRLLKEIKATYIAYPEGLGGIFDQVDQLRSGALFALNERNVAQRSNTLGIRWDFHPSADLKFELQYFDFLTQSTGHMLPDDGRDKPSDTVTTTIIMDVVF